MKSLDIKIALFCELFQKRFCFKDVQCKLSSWNVKKFRNFWFHCIINMKNNYHQAFIVVHLIIVTTNNISLEIQALQLRFLLIYKIMLKSIARACSECTAKQENKASYSTNCTVPDLIAFFGND